MKARRVTVDDKLGVVGMEPGDYGYWMVAGHWIAVAPNGLACNLAAHKVLSNVDDGTITVSPSILVTGETGEEWHGYLEADTWRSC